MSLTPVAAASLSQSGCVRYDNNVCTTMQTCVLDTTTNHGTCYYYIKGQYTAARPLRSAWQTVGVGGLAAAAAFLIAKAIA